jgi:lipoprotein-releasing system permease protein
MPFPYEIRIALRYIRAKRRSRSISFVSAISIGSIALGIATLITVLSVMNGFEMVVRNRLLAMVPHATISGLNYKLDDWQAVAQQVGQDAQVKAVAPYVETNAMLLQHGKLTGTLLQGVEPKLEAGVSGLGQHVESGSLDALQPGQFKLALGDALAKELQLGVGDSVELMVPSKDGGMPAFRQFTVAAIFKLGLYELDHGLVVTDLQDAQEICHLGDSVSGLHLALYDMFKAPQVVREVAGKLAQVYYISDWTRQNGNFFKAVANEKALMFLILSLLVALATFNIVATLVLIVREKQADIAIMRTLGASPRSIMLVFMTQGSLIGSAGTAIGVALGIVLALNVERLVPLLEALLGYHFIDPTLYKISELPSRLELADIVHIALLSLVLGFVSTLYPAWRGAKVQPADALRYE